MPVRYSATVRKMRWLAIAAPPLLRVSYFTFGMTFLLLILVLQWCSGAPVAMHRSQSERILPGRNFRAWRCVLFVGMSTVCSYRYTTMPRSDTLSIVCHLIFILGRFSHHMPPCSTPRSSVLSSRFPAETFKLIHLRHNVNGTETEQGGHSRPQRPQAQQKRLSTLPMRDA